MHGMWGCWEVEGTVVREWYHVLASAWRHIAIRTLGMCTLGLLTIYIAHITIIMLIILILLIRNCYFDYYKLVVPWQQYEYYYYYYYYKFLVFKKWYVYTIL